MSENPFMTENIINNKELNEIKAEQTTNKLKLRKRGIYNVLDKKTMMKPENEIENKVLDELTSKSYSQQITEIKAILESNNEQNLIKGLKYIKDFICPRPFNEKIKTEIVKCGIIDIVIKLFYFNSNEKIVLYCSSILANYCMEYFDFSTQFINHQGIKMIYERLSKNFCYNTLIISNCVIIYKESLSHLLELVNSNNTKYNDLSYECKQVLCHLTNWILCEKKIFCSFDMNTFLCFFKLMEILKKSVSVPNQYDLDFEQGNGAIDNLFAYVLEQKVKDLEYFSEQSYLELLILLSEDPKYTVYLVSGKLNIFDVIKRLCGYLYLTKDSTQEERDNFPMLEPFMLGYCFEIMANLCLEVIKRNDIIVLIYKLFKDYRFHVRYSETVPINIMKLFVSFSENIDKDKNISDFIFSPDNNIIFICYKYYVKNDACYVKVMQFLLNIFEVKNFDEIEKIKFEGLIKCITDGLESNCKEVNSKSVYCIGKIIEIIGRKKYNIDLVKFLELYEVLEKLKNLVMNKNYQNMSEDENAEELINYIESMIKADENK